MTKVIFILVILSILLLSACAPPPKTGETGNTARPVMITISGDLYKYEDLSTNIICYFTSNDLECFER